MSMVYLPLLEYKLYEGRNFSSTLVLKLEPFLEWRRYWKIFAEWKNTGVSRWKMLFMFV